MSAEEAIKWIEENCDGYTTEWHNHIEYKFGQMRDGWTAVFEVVADGEYKPLIQAKDIEHARGYCSRIEPVTVPFSIL